MRHPLPKTYKNRNIFDLWLKKTLFLLGLRVLGGKSFWARFLMCGNEHVIVILDYYPRRLCILLKSQQRLVLCLFVFIFQTSFALERGFVQGDAVSYSFVPNQYWTMNEGKNKLPYLCEYQPLKMTSDEIEPFHDENIQRIDIISQWSTALMFYARREHWNAELIDLMIRGYQKRQLFIIRCYARPNEDEPFANLIDLLNRLWKNRDQVLTNPEGDQATGRQLINNILAVKMGDENLRGLGTDGLGTLYRIFMESITNAEMGGEFPFQHIKPWYNLMGYFMNIYAANEEDVSRGQIPLPKNTQFIGVDVYHYWIKDAIDPLTLDANHLYYWAQWWQDVETRYYPGGLKLISGCDQWRPECRNDTHALSDAIKNANAEQAMMFYIGVTGWIDDYSYPSPIEIYEAYFHNLCKGPWVGLAWWLFGDFKNIRGGEHFINRSVYNPLDTDYPIDVQDYYYHRYVDSKINMFREVVYEQFRHLNHDLDDPGQWSDFQIYQTQSRVDSIKINVNDTGPDASGVNYHSGRVKVKTSEGENWLNGYPCSGFFDGSEFPLKSPGVWRRVYNEAIPAHEKLQDNMLYLTSQDGSQFWYEKWWGTLQGGTIIARAKMIEHNGSSKGYNILMGNQKVRVSLHLLDNRISLSDGFKSRDIQLDTKEWHTYRLCLDQNMITLYVDERVEPKLRMQATNNPGGGYLSFGSASELNSSQKVCFDWVRCCDNAALAPGEGIIIPMDVHLLQTRNIASIVVKPDTMLSSIKKIQFIVDDFFGNTGSSPIYDMLFVPIQLSSFNAVVERFKIKLTWTTQSETDHLSFILYRRYENETNWLTIAEIKSKMNNSSSSLHYSFLDEPPSAGTYEYKLVDLDLNGVQTAHQPIKVAYNPEQDLKLHPNHPNPFSKRTSIEFYLPHTGYCELSVYNTLGQKVSQLLSTVLGKGVHFVSWDRQSRDYQISAGAYFLCLEFNDQTKTHLMWVINE